MLKNYSLKHLLTFILPVMLFVSPVFAQRASYTLTGKVSDASGGLPGATVKIDGTNVGVATDINGAYTISTNLTSGTYQITANSIGYKAVTQSVTLGNQSSINLDFVLNEDQTTLDEVLVIGSTLKSSRRELGNAISSISADKLQGTGTSNLTSALQGKVPGAQITQNSGDPAGGLSVRLRGVKSIRGDSDPLYVIDGVIVSNFTSNVTQVGVGAGDAVMGTNRLADFNPEDIESINVLNGAAAAAIYGSRASNGVVVITTKRGKSGVPQLSFTTSVSSNELRKKVYISTYGKQFGSAALRLHTIGVAPAGVPFVNVAARNLATNTVDVNRYDYQDDIFQQGMGTDNSLSVSGGSDKSQYYASASYTKNEGIIKGTDFQRYNVRLRLDQRLASWAKMTLGLSYQNSFSNEQPNGNVFYSPINSINITNNIYNLNDRDAAGNLKGVEPTRVNPLTIIETFDITQRVNRTVNDFQLNLTPLKGLAVDWIVGLDTYSQLGRQFIPPYPYATESSIPAIYYNTGFASTANNLVTLLNTDLNITYEKQLSDAMSLKLIGGYSHNYTRTDFTLASGINIPVPFISTVNGAATSNPPTYGLNQFAVSGMFGQATVGFKNLFFLTGAIRQDGSTKFSESETNQLYPKLSGSWIVSDMGFWKNTFGDAWNGLKLRASFGEAGGLTALGTYDRFWQFSATPFLGRGAVLASTQFANPLVKPERMRETEFGADLSFIKNRLNLGITLYDQKISDLVVNRVLAASSGGRSIVNNVGDMTNKGFEIAFDATPIKTKDFSWDFTVLFNKNKNTVTNTGSPLVAISNSAGAPVFLVQGQPASVFYGTYHAKNADGSLLLTPQQTPQPEQGTQSSILAGTTQRTAAGQPTGGNLRAVIGDPNPDWTGSLLTNVNYKKLGFRVLFDAVQGNEVFNADKRTRQGVGIGEYAEQELKGEIPRGYIWSIYPIEEWRIDDGSYIKLREIALSYRLPQIVKGIRNLSLSVAGRNLYSWDNYNGYDPETNAGANSDLLRGVDFGNVPIPRTYQVSLKADF